MFQIGMEFDFTRQLKGQGYSFILISAAGIIVPFLLGFVTAPFFGNHYQNLDQIF